MQVDLKDALKLGVKRIKRIYDKSAGLFTSRTVSTMSARPAITYEQRNVRDPQNILESPATAISGNWGGQRTDFL